MHFHSKIQKIHSIIRFTGNFFIFLNSSFMELENFQVDFVENSFDGIFNYMYNKLGNINPCQKNMIKIIPSDTICNNFENLIIQNWKQHWFSFFGPNPFIKFDFINRKIQLSAYTLRTYSGEKDYGHLKSWSILGSNDDENYEIIDEETNNQDLNGNSAFKTFICSNSNKSFRFIKLLMTGNNHAGSDFLVLRTIEFFGTVTI